MFLNAEDQWNAYNDEQLGFNVPYGDMSGDGESRRFEEIMQAEVDEENEIWNATLHFPKQFSYPKCIMVNKLDFDTNPNNPDYIGF